MFDRIMENTSDNLVEINSEIFSILVDLEFADARCLTASNKSLQANKLTSLYVGVLKTYIFHS